MPFAFIRAPGVIMGPCDLTAMAESMQLVNGLVASEEEKSERISLNESRIMRCEGARRASSQNAGVSHHTRTKHG